MGVELWLDCLCSTTAFGDELLVVGDHPALGNWNTGAGVALVTTAETFPRWTFKQPVKLADQRWIQYKYVIRRPDGGLRWEDLGMREVPTFSSSASVAANNYLNMNFIPRPWNRRPRIVAERAPACDPMSGERCAKFRKEGGPQLQPEDVNSRRYGRPNHISSARFTPLTWLPKSLFMQFQRAANVYFLIVSVLVCFDWSPTLWPSTVLPFAAVLLWTALKDLYEDMRRRRDDDAENSRLCWCYDFSARKFVRRRWDMVFVGDFLLTLRDEPFPADMAIVGAHLGQAFISTANLDGESNLKERRAPDVCSSILETLPEQAAKAPDPDLKACLRTAEALVQLLSLVELQAHFQAPKVGPSDMRGQLTLTKPERLANRLPEVNRLPQVLVTSPCTLIADQFVPRGCVLRNTAWLVSVVAYTGEDTQAWLSLEKVKAKVSNLQVRLNQCVKGLVVTLVLFCVYAACMAQVLGEDKQVTEFPQDFCKYWIILYQIVPISLYVCFEIMKLLLGIQINLDCQMVDLESNKHAEARTADLVEEMGEVRHVFTDKTGTLTQNEMRFARCFVAGKDWGEFRSDVAVRQQQKRKILTRSSSSLASADGQSRSRSPPGLPVSGGSSPQLGMTGISSPTGSKSLTLSGSRTLPFEDDAVLTEAPAPGVTAVKQILEDESESCFEELRRFFLCLSVCHDAQVQQHPDDGLTFSGSSPDEVAFLEAANKVGVSLLQRRAAPGSAAATLQVETALSDLHFKVLCVAPFSSDRKRMTVLCEHENKFLVFTKGADSVMGPLCLPGSFEGTAAAQIECYARQGLRTLILAWKALDLPVATELRDRYEAARTSNDERDRLLREWAADVEHSLQFIGISAIEDRLQQGVPAAMGMLKEMGILVWVLTGDKTETAVEIARSCELLAEDTPLVAFIGAKTLDDCKEMLVAAKVRGTSESALVLDGSFVKHVLADPVARRELYGLAAAGSACICCRLAPQQKRGLIEMTREHDPTRITLAIGDGANDVAMIQGAHVGIGVRGKEGNQAVQACDVAISQFRFLVVLLQCHGRRAYRRISVFLCYYIYKHVVLAVGSMCWAHESRFDGNVAYPEWLSSAYSVLFTSLPVIIILGFDIDLPDSLVLVQPELYAEGQSKVHFNALVFTTWMFRGCWHGALAWLAPSIVLGAAGANLDDWGGPFWVSSVTAFSLVLLLVNLMLWMISLNPLSASTLSVLLSSFALYIATLAVLGHTALGDLMQWQIVGTPVAILRDSAALATLCLAPLALLLDLAGLWVCALVRPTPLDKLRWHGRRSLNRVTPGSAQPPG